MNTPSHILSIRRLLTSKLNPPTLHTSQISRDALLERIAGDDARVVLCQAPAGFGKSTLMAQCLERFQAAGVPYPFGIAGGGAVWGADMPFVGRGHGSPPSRSA